MRECNGGDSWLTVCGGESVMCGNIHVTKLTLSEGITNVHGDVSASVSLLGSSPSRV